MKYTVYKMAFETGFHVGNTQLEDSEIVIHADTVFSALCIQALKSGGEERLAEFCDMAAEGRLLFSDAFPYDGEQYYIAKPMIPRDLSAASDEAGNSVKKKQDKKMKYIPVNAVDEYVHGMLDAGSVNSAVSRLGIRELRVLANIPRSVGAIENIENDAQKYLDNFESYGQKSLAEKVETETRPFHLGIFHFREDCGLYLIIGYADDEAAGLADELMGQLEFDGIGGKRSAGLGRFRLFHGSLGEDVLKRLRDSTDSGDSEGAETDGSVDTGSEKKNRTDEVRKTRYVSLSVCLPQEFEMEKALHEADYSLIRRGGFVASESYAPEWSRKKDLYVFSAGSSFTNRFEGGVYDVSTGGNHPVYRYAKPLWLEVVL